MANNTAEQMDNLLDAEGRRRRKDRPVVEEKRHPLETVPFFDRPMGASIKDAQVGEDDIGNPVFKTKLGDTYTVRLNPDQRTTRTKIEEDVLPAVKQYLQDPQLPTKEQVVGAGKAVAGAIKETVSIPKDLLTGKKSAVDVTMGDVFDTAGMMAMGSIPFEVPEGSVRIFGGASAKKLDIKNFAKAEKLYEDGLDPESIRKETGWFKDDVDRKWRFEIDDSKLKLTGEDYPVDFSDSSGQDAWYNYVDEINENRLDDFSFDGSDGAILKLKDFLKHPKLYKHYPQLKDYTIEVGVNIDGDAIGTFDSTTKTIQLSNQIQDLDELKDVLVHEVQHAVQNIEGFLPGSNVIESHYLSLQKYADEAKNILNRLENLGYKWNKQDVDTMSPDYLGSLADEIRDQHVYPAGRVMFDAKGKPTSPTTLEQDLIIEDIKKANEADSLAFKLDDLSNKMYDINEFKYHYYRNRSGEIESNLVEKRRSFDEEKRKLYSPISEKQDQITRPEAYNVADSVIQARKGQSDILLDTVNFDYVPSKNNPSRYVYQYKDKQSSNYGELYDEAIRDFLKSNKDTKKLASLKTGDTVTLNSDGREYFFVEFRPYSEMIRKLDKNYPHVFHEAMGERIEHDKVAGVTLVRIPRGTTKKQRKEIIKYIKNPPVETIDSPPSSVPENFTKFKEFSLGDLMFNSNKSKAKPEATASFRDANFSPNTDSGRLSKINKDFQRALFLQGSVKKPFKLEDMSNPDFDWGKLNLTDSQVSKLADVQKNYLKSGGGQKAVEAAEKKVQDAINARIPAITESLKYKLKTSDKGVVSFDDYKDAVEATVRFDTVEEAAESISNQRGILNKMGPSVMDDMLYDDIVSGAFEQLPDNETFRYILDEGLDKDLVDWAIKEDAIRKSYNKYFKVDNKPKTPKAESVARYSDKVEPEVYDAFVELADIQRGAPEVAMTKAQFDLGGGVLGYALEHTGDLTHRMAEYGGRFGDEYVKPKIDRIFNLLTNDYGFEKEVKENLLSNIKYQFQTEKPNISLKEYEKQYREKVSKSLKKYADEHKKVPVYNDMQLAGREAAIAMGEGRYDDALENIYIIKKAIDEGNYSERSLEFDPKIDFRKPKEFAEGGVAMKDQMEMAFMQEGGLKDDGMDIDPVSGNEVPPGSMAKEVRDDIPAQLSEGEYVVPADVVQYYGVKFFEDLRMEAKRGLADMEANGRIGGEPVDMPMDDTPTVAVSTGGYIDGIPAAEYNVGGMASNLYNNPTQMDQEVNNIISAMYNNPQVMDELARRGIQVNRTQAQMMPQQMNQANPPSQARMGFSPGGLTSNEAAAYNYITSPTIPGPMFQTPGASYIYAAPPQMTTTAAGVDSSVPSVENCNKMGMDYDPIAKICVPREVTQTPQTGGRDDDDGGPKLPTPDPDAWMENYDYTGDLSTLEQQTRDAIAGGSNLPGLFGTFDKGVTMAHSAGHIILLQAQGKTEEAERLKQEWDKARTGALKLTPLEMIDGDRFAIQAAGAHGIELDRDMVSPIDGKPLFRNDRDYERYRANYEVSVKDKEVTPAAAATGKGPIDITKRDDDGGPSLAERIASERKREAESKKVTAAQSAAATKGVTLEPTGSGKSRLRERKEKEAAVKAGQKAGKGYVGGYGFEKGGLMKKKKK